MKRKSKFKMGQHVKIVCPFPIIKGTWFNSGVFLILGVAERRDGDYDYLLENIENPNHPTLWLPTIWLEKVEGEWFDKPNSAA